jgi:hypothetical protein
MRIAAHAESNARQHQLLPLQGPNIQGDGILETRRASVLDANSGMSSNAIPLLENIVLPDDAGPLIENRLRSGWAEGSF